MRIAWVVPGGVDRSGRERVIPWLLWQLERLAGNHEVFVVALDQYPEPCRYRLLGAEVESIGHAPGWRRLVRAFRALSRAGPFDVVHGFWAGLPALAAALAAERLRCPSVVSLFGGELVALPDIGYGGALRWRSRLSVGASLRLADAITVASAPMAALVEQAGFAPLRLPFGVDRRVFVPSPAPPAGPPWRLLHVASLNRVKDQTTLLHAVHRVAALVGEVELDIIGEDTLGGEMQRFAAALGLASRVRFHGLLPSDGLAPFYRRAHLFVLSSRHEGGALVVLEAAACGVATVGTSVGHVADLAPGAAVGVAVGDADALAAGIVTLLDDDERRRRLASAAREWAEAHDADWTASQLDGLYRQLHERHHVARRAKHPLSSRA